MKDYKYEDGLKTLEVCQNQRFASDHNLYIGIEEAGAGAFLGLRSKEEIQKFVYASAVHGGLIEDGEELILRKPVSKRPVPADGVYAKITPGDGRCTVIVEDGKVYVPQYNSDHMVDLTDTFQTVDVPWELVPMRKS